MSQVSTFCSHKKLSPGLVIASIKMEIEDSLFFRLKNQTMSIHENVSSRHPAKTRMPPSNPHFPRVQPGLNQGIKPDKAKYSTKG